MSEREEIRATGLLVDAWGCHYESREWVQASDYDKLRTKLEYLKEGYQAEFNAAQRNYYEVKRLRELLAAAYAELAYHAPDRLKALETREARHQAQQTP